MSLETYSTDSTKPRVLKKAHRLVFRENKEGPSLDWLNEFCDIIVVEGCEYCAVIWSAKHKSFVVTATQSQNTEQLDRAINNALGKYFKTLQSTEKYLKSINAPPHRLARYVHRLKHIHFMWEYISKKLQAWDF